jgi:hypothetical protein
MSCISNINLIDLNTNRIPLLNINNNINIYREDIAINFENLLIECDLNLNQLSSNTITLISGVSLNNQTSKNLFEQNLSSLPGVYWVQGIQGTDSLLSRNRSAINNAYKNISLSHFDFYFVKIIPSTQTMEIGRTQNNKTTIYQRAQLNSLQGTLYFSLFDNNDNNENTQSVTLSAKFSETTIEHNVSGPGSFGYFGSIGSQPNIRAGTRSLNNKFEFCQPDISEYTIAFYYDSVSVSSFFGSVTLQQLVQQFCNDLVEGTNKIFLKNFNTRFRIVFVEPRSFTSGSFDNVFSELASLRNFNTNIDFIYAITSSKTWCCNTCSLSTVGCALYPEPACVGTGWLKVQISVPADTIIVNVLTHELGHNFGARHDAGIMSPTISGRTDQEFTLNSIQEILTGIRNHCGVKRDTIPGIPAYSYDYYNNALLNSIEIKLPTRLYVTRRDFQQDILVNLKPYIVYKDINGRALNSDRFSLRAVFGTSGFSIISENEIGIWWQTNIPWPTSDVGPILTNPNTSMSTLLFSPFSAIKLDDLIYSVGRNNIVRAKVRALKNHQIFDSNECSIIVLNETFFIDLDPTVDNGERIFRYTTEFINNKNLTVRDFELNNNSAFRFQPLPFTIVLLDFDVETEISVSQDHKFLLGRFYKLKLKPWVATPQRAYIESYNLVKSILENNNIARASISVEESETPIYDIDTSFELNITTNKTTYFMDKIIFVPIESISNIENIDKIYTFINNKMFLYKKNYNLSNLKHLEYGNNYIFISNNNSPYTLSYSLEQ